MSNNFTSGMAGPAAVETLNLLWDRVPTQIVGNSTTSLATAKTYIAKLAVAVSVMARRELR